MNFFYLDKSIILVQRILILSIILCSAFFSSCALEEPEKETSSNSPVSYTHLTLPTKRIV